MHNLYKSVQTDQGGIFWYDYRLENNFKILESENVLFSVDENPN